MKLFRFLVPMGALLALLAFLPACEGDGGGDGGGGADTNGGTDTQVTGDTGTPGADVQQDEDVPPGGNDVATTCDPACEACFECVDGECQAIQCDAGETCNPATGECEGEQPECPADCPACQYCDGATTNYECVDIECDAPQQCNPANDQCEDVCDPPCGDCESCNAGVCESLCNPDNCEACNAGTCASTCDEATEICDDPEDDGTFACVDKPDVVCADPNEFGYCQSSIVDELAIAPAPNAATGEPGCCCDFTGPNFTAPDGIADNQLAALVTNLGGMAGFDLVTLNETVAESLAGGDFIILFEHVGLAAGAADTPYYDINFLLGADTDDPEDPTDNFSGTEGFNIMPESLLNGEPLITFEGASVVGGQLEAGPAQFVVPVQIPDPPLDLTLTVDSAIVNATIAANENGVELSDGELCGLVTIDQIFNALNDFAAASCGCLNLTGDLISGEAPTWTCGETDPTCDPEDPEDGNIQEICGTIAQYCSTAVLLLPSFLDVDLDGNATGDAISLGATFGATTASIVGVEPAM